MDDLALIHKHLPMSFKSNEFQSSHPLKRSERIKLLRVTTKLMSSLQVWMQGHQSEV